MICVPDFSALGDLSMLKFIGVKKSRDTNLIVSLHCYVFNFLG